MNTISLPGCKKLQKRPWKPQKNGKLCIMNEAKQQKVAPKKTTACYIFCKPHELSSMIGKQLAESCPRWMSFLKEFSKRGSHFFSPKLHQKKPLLPFKKVMYLTNYIKIQHFFFLNTACFFVSAWLYLCIANI